MVGGVGDGGVCGRWSTGVDMRFFSSWVGGNDCLVDGSVEDCGSSIGLGDISIGGAAASQNHCGGIASGISSKDILGSPLYLVDVVNNGLEMSWGDTSPSSYKSTSPFATIWVFGCFTVDLKRVWDISCVPADVSGRDACGV